MKRFLCVCAAVVFGALACWGEKESPSRLDVSAQPEGVKVLVDGKPRGIAPCSVFGLSEGVHLVQVEAASYVSQDEFVQITAGEYVQKTFSLAEEKGLVLVKTEPAGADVKCNGVSIGTTPLLVTTLASGRSH